MKPSLSLSLLLFFPPVLVIACGTGGNRPVGLSGAQEKSSASQSSIPVTSSVASSARSVSPEASSLNGYPMGRPPGPLPSEGECKHWLAVGDAGFGAAVTKSKRNCKEDSDCAVVSVLCRPSCSAGTIANSQYSEFMSNSYEAKEACAQFWDRGCIHVTPLPIPTCPQLVGVCKASICKAVEQKP